MDKSQNTQFGKVLRHARLTAGLSTRELAHRAGLSHVAIVHFEKGSRSPTTSTVMLLSTLLPAAGPALLGAYLAFSAMTTNAKSRSRLVVQNLIAKAMTKHGAKITKAPDGNLLVELPRIGVSAKVTVS